MLFALASGIIFVKVKSTVYEKFSAEAKSFWQQWELRGTLILSLTLQMILVVFGDRRKFTGKFTPWIAIVVWLTYLSADFMATVCLSTLMESDGEVCTALVALWAPFLLLHLGGPDSITAYSLEDNDLWLRHFLTLCAQVGGALYVFWKYRTNYVIAYLAILMFVAGIIKYGERIYILRLGSTKRLKGSMFSALEPDLHEVDLMFTRDRVDLDTHLYRQGISPEARYLHEAYILFKMVMPIFSDLTLRIYPKLLNDVKAFTIDSKSSDKAFKLVEVELGFLYDVLYTKRTLLNTRAGFILRTISFLTSSAALIAFSLIMGLGDRKESEVDIGISYLLLFGAVTLEIYSVIAHCLSNWAMLWVTKHRNCLARLVHNVTASWFAMQSCKYDFRSMAQLNLIYFSLQPNATAVNRIEQFLDTDVVVRKYWYANWLRVDSELKSVIYAHLLKIREEYESSKYGYNYEKLGSLLATRGDGVLDEKGIKKKFDWSTNKVEFSHSLLLWHLATDLCSHADAGKCGTNSLGSHHKISKRLSEYLLYVQVIRPFLLPSGIGEVRFRDTCTEVRRFLQKSDEFVTDKALDALFNRHDEHHIGVTVKSKSVLFEGVKLAKQLQQLAGDECWDLEQKWELICQVWLEMLTYAASDCDWKEHAQQLQRGRELLTHVSLLMVHLGLSDKIHIVPLPDHLQGRDFQPPWKWDSFDHLAYYLA